MAIAELTPHYIHSHEVDTSPSKGINVVLGRITNRFALVSRLPVHSMVTGAEVYPRVAGLMGSYDSERGARIALGRAQKYNLQGFRFDILDTDLIKVECRW